MATAAYFPEFSFFFLYLKIKYRKPATRISKHVRRSVRPITNTCAGCIVHCDAANICCILIFNGIDAQLIDQKIEYIAMPLVNATSTQYLNISILFTSRNKHKFHAYIYSFLLENYSIDRVSCTYSKSHRCCTLYELL